MISVFSVVTLVIFVVSATTLIYPFFFTIYLPFFGRVRVHINFATAPIIAMGIVWVSLCIGATSIRSGNLETGGVNLKPYNVLLLFLSLAYLAITLDVTGILQAAAFWVTTSKISGPYGWKLFYHFYVTIVLLSIALDPGDDILILSLTAFIVHYSRPTHTTLGFLELLRGSNNQKTIRSDPEVVITFLVVALDNSPIILSGTVLIVQYAQDPGGGSETTAVIAEFVAVGNSTFNVPSIPSVKDSLVTTSATICQGFHITNTTLTGIVVLPFVTSTAGCYIALSIHCRMRDDKTHHPRKYRARPRSHRIWRDNDSTRTWVGTILTGTGLTVIVIVKSSAEFKLNLWFITLPFAAAKLIFNCVWIARTGRNCTDAPCFPDKGCGQDTPLSDVNCDADDLESQAELGHTGEMFRDAHDNNIYGGTFSIVGRDVIQHIYMFSP